MNFVDLAILAAIAYSAWGGIRLGFVMGVFQLVTLVLGVVVALALQAPVGEALAPVLPLAPEVSRLAVFVALLTLIGWGLGLLGSTLLQPVVRRLRATRAGGAADRVLGLVPSGLRGVVYAGSTLLIARLVLPEGHAWREAIDTSLLGPPVVAVFELFYRFAQP